MVTGLQAGARLQTKQRRFMIMRRPHGKIGKRSAPDAHAPSMFAAAEFYPRGAQARNAACIIGKQSMVEQAFPSLHEGLPPAKGIERFQLLFLFKAKTVILRVIAGQEGPVIGGMAPQAEGHGDAATVLHLVVHRKGIALHSIADCQGKVKWIGLARTLICFQLKDHPV